MVADRADRGRGEHHTQRGPGAAVWNPGRRFRDRHSAYVYDVVLPAPASVPFARHPHWRLRPGSFRIAVSIMCSIGAHLGCAAAMVRAAYVYPVSRTAIDRRNGLRRKSAMGGFDQARVRRGAVLQGRGRRRAIGSNCRNISGRGRNLIRGSESNFAFARLEAETGEALWACLWGVQDHLLVRIGTT